MESTAEKKDHTLTVILAVIAGVVLVAVAVVFTRGAPEPLDPSTPQGVVQAYSVAVLDGDEETAATYLTAEASVGCSRFDPGTTNNIRVVLVSTTVRTNSADVAVSVVTSYDDGPFGSSENEVEGNFDQVKVDKVWLIDDAPWQLTICPNPTETK